MKAQSASSYARIVNTPGIFRLLLLINIIGCSLIGILFWITKGWQATSLSLLLVAAASGLLMILQRFGFSQAAGFLLYLLISFVITFNISIGHGIYDEGMLVFPLMIVFSGLLFGKRSTVLVTAISLSQICLVYLFAEAGVVQPFDGAVQMTSEETITSAIIILVTGYIIWLVIDIIEGAVVRILDSEETIEEAYHQTLIAWAKALELGKREGPGHCDRVSSLSSLFAEYVGLDPDQIRAVWQGALLHDIGKMGIPESILFKPEALDKNETSILQSHPRMGAKLIKDIDYLRGAWEIIAYHHEHFDGQGYPDQLRGDRIPYAAQLFSVVDCWDALRTERSCREAWTDQQTLEYIRDQSGKKFDPKIVAAFTALVAKFGLVESR